MAVQIYWAQLKEEEFEMLKSIKAVVPDWEWDENDPCNNGVFCEYFSLGTANYYLSVKQLRVSSNCVTGSLPNDFSIFKNVERLVLEDNNIPYLPMEIGFLPKLETLRTDNPINELPQEICNLPKLRRLYILNSNIQNLPECLGELTNLLELKFFYNYGISFLYLKALVNYQN